MALGSVIRAGIAAYLDTQIASLNVTDDPESLITPPAAVVLPPASGRYIDYDVAMAPDVPAATFTFRIIVLVSKGDVKASTDAADSYLSTSGTNSIPAALFRDVTCGGVADYVHPVEAVFSGQLTWAGIDYMGGQILLEAGAL